MSPIKTRILAPLSVLLILQSCGWQFETPAISEDNVEKVELVAYLSDGDFDWKNVGEIIVIQSGEILQVRRNQIRPEARYIIRKWDENVFSDIEKFPPSKHILLRLDRKNGVICNATHCTTLYAICPSWSEMRKGQKKCVSFSRD